MLSTMNTTLGGKTFFEVSDNPESIDLFDMMHQAVQMTVYLI